MRKIPLDEAKQDLINTQRDRQCCANICDNLEIFITQPGEEDRAYYKMHLLTFRSCLQQAIDLEQKITAYIQNYND